MRASQPQVDLGYGALAVALYAAPDLPYPERNRLSHQELAAYAEQGVNRLGGAGRVRTLCEDLMRLNRALLRDKISADTYRAEVMGLLRLMSAQEPDLVRFERCVAHDYGRLCSPVEVCGRVRS